jgi:hypothetical protein
MPFSQEVEYIAYLIYAMTVGATRWSPCPCITINVYVYRFGRPAARPYNVSTVSYNLRNLENIYLSKMIFRGQYKNIQNDLALK